MLIALEELLSLWGTNPPLLARVQLRLVRKVMEITLNASLKPLGRTCKNVLLHCYHSTCMAVKSVCDA